MKPESLHSLIESATDRLTGALAADKKASVTVKLTVRLSPNFFEGLVDMKNIPAAQAAVKKLLEGEEWYPHQLGLYVSDVDIDDALVEKNLLNI